MERKTARRGWTRRTMMLGSVGLIGSMVARYVFADQAGEPGTQTTRPHERDALGSEPTPNWRDQGVKIIPGSQLDLNTPQTSGMTRAAAITHARTGANKLWVGTVAVDANAKTGAHHHGELESVLYVISGRGRIRWGEHLEFVAEAGPGDFIYIPPFVPHQEINASKTDVLSCVVIRSGQEPIVVNLDIEPAEPPEAVYWVD